MWHCMSVVLHGNQPAFVEHGGSTGYTGRASVPLSPRPIPRFVCCMHSSGPTLYNMVSVSNILRSFLLRLGPGKCGFVSQGNVSCPVADHGTPTPTAPIPRLHKPVPSVPVSQYRSEHTLAQLSKSVLANCRGVPLVCRCDNCLASVAGGSRGGCCRGLRGGAQGTLMRC